MLRLRLLLTLLIASSLTPSFQAATITVDDAGADYTSIQAAINAAGNGDEIIVSPGTYQENINFDGKAITVRSASGDPVDTIIDGGGNGSVVTCDSGETLLTVLDGFTITNGSASYGGGMYNEDSSPTVTNCTFSGNSANGWGGGMRNSASSSPTVSHCTFSGNSANAGGGMNNYESSPAVTNCTFSGNTAGWGGGMYNRFSSSPTVSNCTFSGNTAEYGGGMRNYDNSSPTVSNCILWGDSPDEIYNTNSSTPTVRYSDLQGGLPSDTVDGGGNIAVYPLFVDADGPDNTAGTGDDNLRLSSGSSCIDAGDNATVPAGISFDLDGNPRFKDSLFSPDTGNGTAPLVDMGPYENMSPCLGDDTSGDSDGDGFCDNIDSCGLPGDINCDSIVNLLDLALLAEHWLTCNGPQCENNPCDICDYHCPEFNPCEEICGGDPCDPACGGDPCDPACGGDPCDPACGGTCDPACGGDPCSEHCVEDPCADKNGPCYDVCVCEYCQDPECPDYDECFCFGGPLECNPLCPEYNPYCNPECNEYEPCHPMSKCYDPCTCSGACDSACGGDPCDPACGGDPCDPACDGSPCDPA